MAQATGKRTEVVPTTPDAETQRAKDWFGTLGAKLNGTARSMTIVQLGPGPARVLVHSPRGPVTTTATLHRLGPDDPEPKDRPTGLKDDKAPTPEAGTPSLTTLRLTLSQHFSHAGFWQPPRPTCLAILGFGTIVGEESGPDQGRRRVPHRGHLLAASQGRGTRCLLGTQVASRGLLKPPPHDRRDATSPTVVPARHRRIPRGLPYTVHGSGH